jgi:hypothetical protein
VGTDLAVFGVWLLSAVLGTSVVLRVLLTARKLWPFALTLAFWLFVLLRVLLHYLARGGASEMIVLLVALAIILLVAYAYHRRRSKDRAICLCHRLNERARKQKGAHCLPCHRAGRCVCRAVTK